MSKLDHHSTVHVLTVMYCYGLKLLNQNKIYQLQMVEDKSLSIRRVYDLQENIWTV